MSDIKNKNIVLKSIEKKTFPTKAGGTFTKYVVLAENPEAPDKPVRYSFSETKVTGAPTKALLDYQKGRYIPGDGLRIGYTEKARKYTDKTGVERDAIDLTIISMELATGGGLNATPSGNGIKPFPSGNVEGNSSQEDEEIRVEDIPF